jgi:hypothetical protein
MRLIMSEPTVEYWRAKADLCRDLAIMQMNDEEMEKEAGMNLMRMVHALSMVDSFNEGGDNDN